MKLKRSNRIAAVLFALALGVSGNALAAQADTEAISDADLEAAVADIPDDMFADVPKDHWAYEALDTLAQKGIIDGYADGTFQGNRSMSRYEMAAIIAKARNSGAIGNADLVDQAILEMLEDEYKADLKPIKAEILEMKKDMARIKAGANSQPVKLHGFLRVAWNNDTNRNSGDPYQDEKDSNRFLLNLQGDIKLSEGATAHFETETNARYGRNYEHKQNDEPGYIKSLYVTGTTKNGINYFVGRKWQPLGMNFALLGAKVTGVQADVAIENTGLRAGAYYYSMAEYDDADFSFWGPYIKGSLGHNFDISLTYAKINSGQKDAINKAYYHFDPDSRYSNGNWIGSKAWDISVATNVARNLRLTVDYARTNHVESRSTIPVGSNTGDNNRSWIAQLNYKWTNPAVVGSFGAFLKYHDIGRNGTIWNGDEDGSILRNSKGWTVGCKYVPWNNVEWEVLYQIADCNYAPYKPDAYGDSPWKRHYFRTTFNFHF